MDEFVHNRYKTVPLTGYLREGGYVFGSIGLFVCLFVRTCAQKVLNRCSWNFHGWWRMGHETND